MSEEKRESKEKDAKLVKNCLETPDGTVLYSRSRHDYKTHLDANGKTYMIDGGLDYVRCSANGDEIHHCVWDDDPFDEVRKAVEWGTYGINGDQPLTWVKLCDMETAHINAVLKNVPSIGDSYARAFRLELELRAIREEVSFVTSNN
jgi:hypothetical protein